MPEPHKNPIQLVIFDRDGVLVDSEVISNEVLARALTAEGLPTTLAEARRNYQSAAGVEPALDVLEDGSACLGAGRP